MFFAPLVRAVPCSKRTRSPHRQSSSVCRRNSPRWSLGAERLEARWLLSADPIVTVDTNLGNFQIELLPSAAPQTVANFLSYVDSGAYTNTIFHRSVPGFVEQAGGFTSASDTYSSTSQFTTIPTNSPISLEYNLPNTAGTVAMARTSDLNSATDEWFVNLVDNTQTLGTSNGGGYAVFGKVLGNGMQVLNAIAALSVTNADSGTFSQLPLEANNQLVRISSITVDSIDGTVFTDANSNGQLDAGENGVAGRTVFVDVDGTGAPDANNPSTTTDANGHYSFSGLTAATYTVREVLPSGVTLSTPIQTATVAADQTASDVNFGEIPSITGTAFADSNGNGQLDSGEHGIASLTVFVDIDGTGAPDASNPSTTTDANGAYSFSGLAAGSYTVRVVAPTNTSFAAASQAANVTAGQTASSLNFAEIPSIVGTVFNDANANGTLDSGEAGVAGRTVFLDIDGTGAPDATNVSTTTDANGNYTFLGLASGSYTVREVVPSGVTATTQARTVTVTSGQSASNVNFGEELPAITGTVFTDLNGNGQFDTGDQGVAGRTVFLDVDGSGAPDATNPSTTTDSLGKFSFTGVAAGSYTVREVLPANVSLSTPTQSITVTAGQTTSGVNLGEFPSIVGTVFADANGNGALDTTETGVAGRTVFLDIDGSGTPDASNPSTTTDATGRYWFSGIAAGTYNVREVVASGVQLTTAAVQSATVTLGHAASSINFGETATSSQGSISGQVFEDVDVNGQLDGDEPGLAGRTVFLDIDGTGAPDSQNTSTTTDASGNYSFMGLAAGSYTVREVASADHGVSITTTTQTVTVTAGQPTTGVNFGDVITSTIAPLPVWMPSPSGSSLTNDATGKYIDAVYESVLGRTADDAGLAYWQSQLSQGVSRDTLARTLWDSTEHRSAEIDQYYHTFLNRAADAAGKAFWLQTFSDPSTFDTLATEKLIIEGFLTSAEYSQQLHSSDTDFITALYQDLDLRAPDSAGLSSWQNALQNGQTRLDAIKAFLGSTEASNQLIDGFYAEFLHRTVDAAGQQNWDQSLQSDSTSVENMAVGILSAQEFYDRVTS